MYVAKTDRTEEFRVRREPTGTLPELFTQCVTKGSETQTLNPEPVSIWDYEQIMTQILSGVRSAAHPTSPLQKKVRLVIQGILVYFKKYSIWVLIRYLCMVGSISMQE